MSVRNVGERQARSIEAVRAFFSMFYGSDITLTEVAEEDQILLHVGPAGKVVAVTADFLAEFEPARIAEHLAAWNVAHVSRTLERGYRLVVTSEGPEVEPI